MLAITTPSSNEFSSRNGHWQVTTMIAEGADFLGLSFDSAQRDRYYCAPMSQPLPEQIDPFRLVRQKRILVGTVELSRMLRLAPLLQRAHGQAHVELEFGTDDMGVKFARGEVIVELPLTCQRCLQPMNFPVRASIALGFVTQQHDADAMPSHYDPLLVEHVPIPLLDLVEDELLLSLPIVATHEPGACEAAVKTQEPVEPTPAPKRENPFAVLAQLKAKKDV